jgi:hypothetical protein
VNWRNPQGTILRAKVQNEMRGDVKRSKYPIGFSVSGNVQVPSIQVVTMDRGYIVAGRTPAQPAQLGTI